jgi:hypothetical protein
MAASGSTAYIVVAQIDEGVTCVTVENDAIRDVAKLADWREASGLIPALSPVLRGRAAYLAAAVAEGTAFVLWAANEHADLQTQPLGVRHSLVLRRLSKGAWAEEVILSQGDGAVIAVNMTAADGQTLHVACVRQIGPSRYGCFYHKVCLVKITWGGQVGKDPAT